MQPVRKSLDAAGRRFRELPVSSKLLLGSLAVILGMSMFLVAQYTARPALVPLPLNGDAEAVAAAVRWMDERAITYQEQGDRVLVPTDQRHLILAQLTENNLVSASDIDFSTLIEQESPFRSQQQNHQLWLTAKMNELSKLIGNFRGVKRAKVVISDEPRRAGFGASHAPATATVTVHMAQGEMPEALVDAVAATVIGGHAGLRPENVTVIDANAGRQRRARSPHEVAAGTNLEHQVRTESLVQERIERVLEHIPGVVVSVRATVATYNEERQSESFTDPVVGPLSERSSSVTSSGPAPGGEAGVRSNTGLSVPGTGSRGSTYASEQSEAKLAPAFPSQRSVIRDPKGYATKINASIGVPRAYLLYLAQTEAGATDPPDDATLAAIQERLVADVRQLVEPLIDTEAVEDGRKGTVVVRIVNPAPPTLAADGTIEVPALNGLWSGGGGSVISAGLVRTVVLGALGLVSLAMMLMMVRKAQVGEALPSAAELAGIPPALRAEESDLVGEADEASPALEGMELDDEALRRQQMLRQINDLVGRAPEEAASLIRRWMRAEA